MDFNGDHSLARQLTRWTLRRFRPIYSNSNHHWEKSGYLLWRCAANRFDLVYGVAFSKHVLIDAANVLYAWPETRALFKRDRETARSLLIQRLIGLHDAESVRVTVVIDGRGPNLLLDHPSQQSTFTVIYTPRSLSADDVIEQMVGRSTVPSACEVATGDQAQRSTIEASGAIWLPTSDLLARIERAEKRLVTQVTGINRTTAREWGRR